MPGPYSRLYIYEIEGILGELPDSWHLEDFMGCYYEGGYTFLFFSSPRRRLIENHLAFGNRGRIRSATVIPYEDWEAGSPLRPFGVGPLWIFQPWETGLPPQGAIPMAVDPGISFGSGHHASTRTCLELLVSLYERDRPLRVLDLGTGSGILAIAAARLGARHVLAVDAQPVAVETARANVERNGLGRTIDVRLLDAARVLGEPAELLMANMALDGLCALIERPEFFGKSWYLLSGLVGRQLQRLTIKVASSPLVIERVLTRNNWHSLLLRSRG